MPMTTDDDPLGRLQRWQTVVDEAIAEARERGEFDELPGRGKPLNLRRNPLAGDQELAFHALANAGLAPPWLEHDKAVAAARAELDAARERAREEARAPAARRPSRATNAAPMIPGSPRGWRWWPSRRHQPAAATHTSRRFDPAVPLTANVARQRARCRYLALAAALDDAIARRNAVLPVGLRFLERPRYAPERAADDFDAAWPDRE